jgi:uncharacterized Zn-finger protein
MKNVVYINSHTDKVSCDGDMTSSVDGHPKVYMSFSNEKSRAMTKDISQVQCDYCGKKFIRT